MGRRHLTDPEAGGALRGGRSVEQFLGREVQGERMVLRWLEVRPSGRAFDVLLHEVEDIGSPDFVDVYEFPPLDEDGEERIVSSAESAEEALEQARGEGAEPGHWVNEGVIQDEYLDAL